METPAPPKYDIYIYVHLHNCIFPAKVIQIYKETTWTIGYIAIFDMWSSSSFDETFMSFFACFFSYSNIEKLELMDRTTFKHGERHSILYFSPSQATFWIAYWDCTTDKPYCRSRINSPSPLHKSSQILITPSSTIQWVYCLSAAVASHPLPASQFSNFPGPTVSTSHIWIQQTHCEILIPKFVS